MGLDPRGGGEAGLARRIRALEAAGLDLLPEGDRARLLALPEDRRRRAETRLAVVLDRQAPPGGRVFGSPQAESEYLGLSRDRIDRIVKAMRRPGLEALGLEIERRGGNKAKEARRSFLAEEALSLLEADPAMGPSALLARLQEGIGAGLSRPMLVSVVDEVRPVAPPSGPFGRLVFDSAAIRPVARFAPLRRLFALVDQGTGLVVAARLTQEVALVAGYRALVADLLGARRPRVASAAGDGRLLLDAFPDDTDVDRLHRGVEDDCVYVLPSDRLVGLAALADAELTLSLPKGSPEFPGVSLRAEGGWRIVGDARRLGRRIVGAVGRGIGDARLETGWTAGVDPADADDARRSTVPAEEAAAAVVAAVAAHNDARLEMALVRGPGDGVPADVLRSAVDEARWFL